MTCRRQMSTSMDGLTLSITLAQAKKDAISAMDQALEIAEVLRHGGSRFSYRANVKRRQNAAVTLAMRDRSRLRSTRLLGVNFWSKHDEQKNDLRCAWAYPAWIHVRQCDRYKGVRVLRPLQTSAKAREPAERRAGAI